MSVMATTHVIPRFFVISDTHNFEFDGSNSSRDFRQLGLRVDLVLHCSNLSQLGGVSTCKKALKILGNIDAETRVCGSR